MNVLMALDNNYAMPSFVMLYSLFENTKDKISLFIIHSDLSESNQNRFKEITRKFNADINIITVDKDLFGDAHTSIHITKPAYYRLLAHTFLPQNIARILYVDPDIVVTNDLSELYNMDFVGEDGMPCYYVVCEGPGVSQNLWKVYDDLDIPREYKYFNSGVLMINLELLRRNIGKDVFMDFIEKKNDMLKYHDQDVLNALFYDKVRYVDWHIYNQTILHIKNEQEADICLAKASIIHYAGSDKPWNYDYKSYYFNLWWNYAKRPVIKSNILKL